MRKIIPIVITVCLVVTLIPSVSFSAETQGSDPAQPAAQEPYDPAQPAAQEPYDPAEPLEAEPLSEDSEGQPGEEPSGTGSDDPTGTGTDDPTGPTAQDPTQPSPTDPTQPTAPPAPKGWVKDKYGHWLYYKNGAPLKGFQTIGSYKYYFSSKGYRQTGFKTINGKRYFFRIKNGRMRTGWMKLKGKKYYFQKTGTYRGAAVTGIRKLGKKRYYFNSKGVMKTGFVRYNGKRYYFIPKKGTMYKGWLYKNGRKYYFSKKGKNIGAARMGLTTIGGEQYYFSKDKGIMKTGVVDISGQLYYFYSNGVAVHKKGWFQDGGGTQRYCRGKGKIASGTVKIKSTWYKFSAKTGALLDVIGDDVDKKVLSETSDTRYLIVVLLSKHQLRVYKGRKNTWFRSKTFQCTTGKAASPTPKGEFRVEEKGEHIDMGTDENPYRCWYFTRFTGRYMISSVPFYDSDSPVRVKDGRLGVSVSDGSIRLGLPAAKWVYVNVPRKTRILIQ